ncbi:MAG: amidohydrolase [Anditalea sp.]
MNKAVLKKLSLFRQELHQYPELSGQEIATAKRIKNYFEPLKPDETITHIGGEGIAFTFKGMDKGPTTLIRCELDAVPTTEVNNIKHKSKVSGKSHTCGHDGHMAIVCGVGEALAEERPKKGKVVLLFQPAEETGEGAAEVLKSSSFTKIKPDYAFALHNLPGYAKNEIVLKKGPFSAASKGMEISLKGRTSHAAYPEDGNSPAEAMSKIIIGLQKLPTSIKEFSQITVVNSVLGEISFGTTPGEAIIRATLRSYEDHVMEELTTYSEQLVHQIASEYDISVAFNYRECFSATENNPEAWEFVNTAAKQINCKIRHILIPFRWSEDFGEFSKVTKTMIFGLGAGSKHPQLHEGVFDFPDATIPTGVNMFISLIRQINH